MKKILIPLFIFIAIYQSNAQQPPCMPDYYGLTYAVPRLQEFPPLSIYMPYDVLIGYIALDSISHNLTKVQLQEFLDRQTWNDTIRYLMRFYYNIVDYDPILYMNARELIYEDYMISPEKIDFMILNRILELSPEPILYEALLTSDYILHIRANDTLHRITSTSCSHPTTSIVTGVILDTIKGKVLPRCKDISLQFPVTKPGKNDEVLDYQSNCFQFEYRLEWEPENCGEVRRHSVGEDGKILTPRLVDTNGVPWVKANQEYIIFIYNNFLCYDYPGTNNMIYSPRPHLCDSKTYGIYPIVDGFVQDPGNDFGLGTSVNVTQFKSFLRAKISEISNYNGN